MPVQKIYRCKDEIQERKKAQARLNILPNKILPGQLPDDGDVSSRILTRII